MNHAAELKKAKERIAKLEAAVDALTNPKPAPSPATDGLPAGQVRDHCGLIRDGKGAIVVTAEARAHADREREQRRANDIAAEAAEKAEKASRGGRWRDPTGLWRDASGQLLSVTARNEAARQEVIKSQAEENRNGQKSRRRGR
jgi:hypothetical protein